MRINLLQLGTEGVDMKTNPLLLGNKKLHAATNLSFDEGLIRTRPGFIYTSWGAEGQFQGASEYRPRQGLSANTLSDLTGGLVVVADGAVWFGCRKIGEEFFCKGDVNIFQAENYLIFQCRETPTYWWNGVGTLTASPGMNEQDWNDPATPVQELEIVAPVANIPDCDLALNASQTPSHLLVIDHVTEEPLAGVIVAIGYNDKKVYTGVTDVNGYFEFYATPREYQYSVIKAGYVEVQGGTFEVTTSSTPVTYEECMPPLVLNNGFVEIVVRMVPDGMTPTCSFELSELGTIVTP